MNFIYNIYTEVLKQMSLEPECKGLETELLAKK